MNIQERLDEERKDAGYKLAPCIDDEDCLGCVFADDDDGCWDGPDCGDLGSILVVDTEVDTAQ